MDKTIKIESLSENDSKPEFPFDSKSFLENIRKRSREYFETDLLKEIEKAKLESRKRIQCEINKKMRETEQQMKDFWTHLEKSVFHDHINLAFDKISSNLESANMKIFDSQLEKTFNKSPQPDISSNENLAESAKQSSQVSGKPLKVCGSHSSAYSPLYIDFEDANSNFPTLVSKVGKQTKTTQIEQSRSGPSTSRGHRFTMEHFPSGSVKRSRGGRNQKNTTDQLLPLEPENIYEDLAQNSQLNSVILDASQLLSHQLSPTEQQSTSSSPESVADRENSPPDIYNSRVNLFFPPLKK